MPKLPRVTGKELVRFLQKSGFSLLRVRGSHHFFEKGKLRTTVPVHGNEHVKLGTLQKILRDIDMSPAEFARNLKQK